MLLSRCTDGRQVRYSTTGPDNHDFRPDRRKNQVLPVTNRLLRMSRIVNGRDHCVPVRYSRKIETIIRERSRGGDVNIFFDFDYTLVAKDGSLRPGTHGVLARLRQESHRLFIWSGIGLRTEEAAEHDLLQFMDGVFQKPIEDFERGLIDLGITARPDAVVDDHSEIVRHFGGVVIRPYFWPDQGDKEMERVYQELRKLFGQPDGSAPVGHGTRRTGQQRI